MIHDDLESIQEVNEEFKIWRIEFGANLDLNFQGSLVRFASYITASGRAQLMKTSFILGFDNILYFDTDSIITNSLLPNEMVSGDELGKWKMEHKIDNIEIFGPKFYRLNSIMNEEVEHCKGVRKKALDEEFWKQVGEKGESNIINENVFHRKFGQVWVTKDKKLIRCVNESRKWRGNKSRPFIDFNEFK